MAFPGVASPETPRPPRLRRPPEGKGAPRMAGRGGGSGPAGKGVGRTDPRRRVAPTFTPRPLGLAMSPEVLPGPRRSLHVFRSHWVPFPRWGSEGGMGGAGRSLGRRFPFHPSCFHEAVHSLVQTVPAARWDGVHLGQDMPFLWVSF